MFIKYVGIISLLRSCSFYYMCLNTRTPEFVFIQKHSDVHWNNLVNTFVNWLGKYDS